MIGFACNVVARVVVNLVYRADADAKQEELRLMVGCVLFFQFM